MKERTRWLIVIAMCILWGVLVLTSCTARYVPVVRYNTQTAGGTNCDQRNNPVIMVADGVTVEEAYFIRIHEEQHVADIRAWGDCKSFLERYRVDGAFRFDAEARAYCADLNARVEAGYPRDTLTTLLTHHMQRLYAMGLTLDSVRSRLPCGGRHADPP